MAHVLILGMTESGKTTLAANLVKVYKRNQYGVIVLDELQDPRWQADYITDDPEEFLQVFWQSRECIAVIDEGGESVGRYDKAMQKTATRGRHWGHSCHYIAQRASQLAPIVRDQCTHLFLFCSSAKDGKLLAEEWNKPELAECSNFKQGEYIHAVKFGQSTKQSVGNSVQQSKEVNEHESSDSRNRRVSGNIRGIDADAERRITEQNSGQQSTAKTDRGTRTDGGEGSSEER